MKTVHAAFMYAGPPLPFVEKKSKLASQLPHNLEYCERQSKVAIFIKVHERQEEMETIAHEASGLAQLVFSEILPQASAS